MRLLTATLIIAALLSSTSWAEEEMMVDQADSLDFDSFHKPPKKEAERSIFDFFSDSKSTTNDPLPLKISDEILKVQQRYTPEPSKQTINTEQYSAFSAINALHQQMAKHCPQGWVKTGEWSTPIDADFQLHYQFHCLL